MTEFFTSDEYYTGPALTDEMVHAAERELGYTLPKAYVALLCEKNGGVPHRCCLPITYETSSSKGFVEITAIFGIGGAWGIDNKEFGSQYLVKEWGYPDLGIVVCSMPSGGHDTVMLDYSECGPHGEPDVIYVDDERDVYQLAETFADFLERLVHCPELPV